MQSKWFRGAMIALALAVLAGGHWLNRFLGFPPSIHRLIDLQTIATLMERPEQLTAIGLVDGTWLDFHSGALNDISFAQKTRDIERTSEYLAELAMYDPAWLGEEDRISLEVLSWAYRDQLALAAFPWTNPADNLYPVNQIFGVQTGLPRFLQSQHVVRNALTAENYVKRLFAFGPKFEQLIALVDAQTAMGVIPPDFVVDKVISGIDSFLAPPPAENPLAANFAGKLAELADLGEDGKTRLKADAVRAVDSVIYPAYRRLKEVFVALRPKATHDAGVWKLQDGEAFYQAMLHHYTTTAMTADEIHELGLREVARIESEMDVALKAQGYADGTVAERMKILSEDPKFLYPESDEGRERLLERYRAIVADMYTRLPRVFVNLPPQPVQVERVPVYAQEGAAGAYYQGPSLDGRRPGVFFANLASVKETQTWSMPTLAYHEAVPGHHLQNARARMLDFLPLVRRVSFYSAYGEGWALYAEKLAKELGVYDSDPLGDIGRMQANIFRAVRLVVDTGLHAKRWSREEAVKYMVDHTGMVESDVVREIERYVVTPGQACAYYIGFITIVGLRERAEKELGERFDLAGFHDQVLSHGAVPLSVLEAIIERWIASRKA